MGGTQRPMVRGFARGSNQASSCSWKWRSLAKRGRAQAALEEVLKALDDALGLRVGRLAEKPADPQGPQNAANSSLGRPSWAWRPDWRSQTNVSGSAPATTSSADPGQQVRRLLGEDQRASTRARVAKARNDDKALPRLAMTDRELLAGLPQVELADLPGPIDRPLKRPRCRRKQRPDLAQIVIDDRLAAIEAQRRDQLTDTLARQPRIGFSSRWTSSLNGSSFDAADAADSGGASTATRGEPCCDRSRAPGELLDRQAADEMLPAQLSPALRVQHPFLPASITVDQARVRTHPENHASRGCIFNRQKGVSIQPAPTTRAPGQGATRRVTDARGTPARSEQVGAVNRTSVPVGGETQVAERGCPVARRSS